MIKSWIGKWIVKIVNKEIENKVSELEKIFIENHNDSFNDKQDLRSILSGQLDENVHKRFNEFVKIFTKKIEKEARMRNSQSKRVETRLSKKLSKFGDHVEEAYADFQEGTNENVKKLANEITKLRNEFSAVIKNNVKYLEDKFLSAELYIATHNFIGRIASVETRITKLELRGKSHGSGEKEAGGITAD